MGPTRPAAPTERRAPPKFGPRTPRPPPTDEQVLALAQRDHVPYRIARGELEGKMKARIWRKLHAEEARRFDQVYELIKKTPGLDLADAFGIIQSGMSPEEFQQRKDRALKKDAVREARGSVSSEAVNGFIETLVQEKAEVSVVLGERTVLDVLVGVEPIAFLLERSGRIEKLQVVLLARRPLWDKLASAVERDPKLFQKPVAVVRQPERRPVSDPRPFLDHLGQPLELTLRNGIRLALPLRAIGPFDLLLGEEGNWVFVPLHAVLQWSAAGAPTASSPDAARSE